MSLLVAEVMEPQLAQANPPMAGDSSGTATSTGDGAFAIGASATTGDARYATSIGYFSAAIGNFSEALGRGANASARPVRKAGAAGGHPDGRERATEGSGSEEDRL